MTTPEAAAPLPLKGAALADRRSRIRGGCLDRPGDSCVADGNWPLAMKLRKRSQTGFTLVEVLVALSLMAVLAGMAWQGLDGISRTRTASLARVEQTLRLNTVLAQWEQDLQSLFDTDLVPALAFDGATVRLVRRQPDGLQVVAWSLREQRWLRWTGPIVTRRAALQESWLASQQLLGNEAAQLRMQDGLTSWQLYFYRGNAWSNAQSSAGAAPPAPAPTRSAPVRGPPRRHSTGHCSRHCPGKNTPASLPSRLAYATVRLRCRAVAGWPASSPARPRAG